METDRGHIVQFHKETKDCFLLTTANHETGEVSPLLISDDDAYRLLIYLKAYQQNPAAFRPLFSE